MVMFLVILRHKDQGYQVCEFQFFNRAIPQKKTQKKPQTNKRKPKQKNIKIKINKEAKEQS